MVRVITTVLILLVTIVPVAAQAPAPPPATEPAKKATAPKQKAKAAATPMTPAAAAGPCRIGVLSTVGDKFVLQTLGFTVFGNDLQYTAVNGWELNDLVVARVRAAVGAGVRKIAVPANAFAELDEPRLFRNLNAETAVIVRQITSGTNCERYILARGIALGLSGTNQFVNGIGVLKSLAGGRLVLAINLQLIDGQDFHTIRQRPADLGEQGLFRESPPGRRLEDELIPRSLSDVIGSTALRDATRDLLTTGLDVTLPKLLAPEQ